MELGIGIAALVLSLASLVWQALTWRWSTAKAMIDVWIAEIYGGEDRTSRVIERADLIVNIRNVGRAPMQAVHVALRAVEGDFGIDPAKYRVSEQPLPLIIEPGCTETLVYNAADIAAALEHHVDIPCEMRAVVALGHGKTEVANGTAPFTGEISAVSAAALKHGVRDVRIVRGDG